MKIRDASILVLSIPMKQVVHHALASRKTAQNVLVVLQDEDGVEGWGECCPRPYVTGETVESVVQDLQTVLFPDFIASVYSSFDEVVERLAALSRNLRRDQQAAFCALELAALDLAGKVWQCSAGQPLGEIQHPQVRYSGVIAAETPAVAERQAAFLAELQVREVKLKTTADLETNLALLRSARGILGDAVELRIDANCAWNAAEALRQLPRMQAFHLAGVEQPVPPLDLAGMKRITAAQLLPVVADESLCSRSDAETLIREQACDIFNLRISKCGGLLNTLRLYRCAAAAGWSCQLGAQVGEYGFLSAAGRQLAARLPQLRWLEGSYGVFLLESDVTTPDLTIGAQGIAPALDGTGLGVLPDGDRVNRYREAAFRYAG
jgi:muconate cycloisomerase